MRKAFFAIVLCTIAILNVIMIVLLPINASKVYSNNQYGYVQIKVLEKNTLKPVPEAIVCIVETREYITTDKSGNTKKVAVPIIRNTNFDDILLRDWGEFTIIIYATGYATHISFYNPIYAGITRLGLVCHITPILDNADDKITYNSNSPNNDYIKTLVTHFTPE